MSEQHFYDVTEYRTDGGFVIYEQSELRFYDRDEALRYAMHRASEIIVDYDYDENDFGYLITVTIGVDDETGFTVNWFWSTDLGC